MVGKLRDAMDALLAVAGIVIIFSIGVLCVGYWVRFMAYAFVKLGIAP